MNRFKDAYWSVRAYPAPLPPEPTCGPHDEAGSRPRQAVEAESDADRIEQL